MVPTYDPTYYPTRSPTLEPTLSVSIHFYKLEYRIGAHFIPSFVKFANLFPFLLNHTAHSLANLITYNLADAGTNDRANFEPN